MSLLRDAMPQWTGYGYGYEDGSGDGYGYGYGDGHEDGSGYGYGYGSWDGSGYGYGYGDGSGDGYGYGYGDGDGYGYGYGYGDGYGDGSGDGYYIALYNKLRVNWPRAHKEASVIALWKSDAQGCPSNGGYGPGVTIGETQEISGPLKLCTAKALHATMEPNTWKGERLWIVALYGEVQREGDKLGALKREILWEIR